MKKEKNTTKDEECKMDAHFPFGQDMVPSPVRRTVAAAVEEPPLEREPGGKTRTAVSKTGASKSAGAESDATGSSSVGSESAAPSSVDGVAGTPRERGQSMMAMQRATV